MEAMAGITSYKFESMYLNKESQAAFRHLLPLPALWSIVIPWP